MPESISEFAKRIKSKYPEYADKDDTDLVTRWVKKYPEYKDKVSFEPAPTPETAAQPGFKDQLKTFASDGLGRLKEMRQDVLKQKPLTERVQDIQKAGAPDITSAIPDIPSPVKEAAQNKLKAAGGSVGGMVQGVGGLLRAGGSLDEKIVVPGSKYEKALGEKISGYGKKMQEFYKIEDPTFADKLTAAATSGATFFVPGMGIARGVSLLSAVPKLAAVAGAGISSAFESGIEAGLVYETMITKGKTEAESLAAASKTFGANLALNTGLNYAGGLFHKILPGAAKVGTVKSGLKAATSEGIQEGAQQAISNVATGEEAGAGVGESALLGGIVGGGMSVGIDALGGRRGPGPDIPAQGEPSVPPATPVSVLEGIAKELPRPGTFPAYVLEFKVKQAMGLKPTDTVTEEMVQAAYESGKLPADLAAEVGLSAAVAEMGVEKAKIAQETAKNEAIQAAQQALVGEGEAIAGMSQAAQARAAALVAPEPTTGKPAAAMSEEEFVHVAQETMPDASREDISKAYKTAMGDAVELGVADEVSVAKANRIDLEPMPPEELPAEHEFYSMEAQEETAAAPGSVPLAAATLEQAQAEFPSLTEAQHKAIIKNAVDTYQIGADDVVYPDVKAYAQDKLKAEQAEQYVQDELSRQLAEKGHVTPILNMLWKIKLNRKKSIDFIGGELDPQELKGYITENGGMSPAQAAERAWINGWITENGENELFDAIDAELRTRNVVRNQGVRATVGPNILMSPGQEYAPQGGLFSGEQGDLFDTSGNVNPVAVQTQQSESSIITEPIKTESTVAPTSGEITDVGDQLWYNKRNILARKMGWEDIKDLNPTLKVKEAVKSKIWARPDYEELVAGGMNPLTAYAIKQVYDSISSKPSTYGTPKDADIKIYLEEINRVKDAVWEWAKNPTAQKEFLVYIGESAKKAAINPFSVSRFNNLVDIAYPPDANNKRYENQEVRAAVRMIGGKVVPAMQISVDDMVKAMKEIQSGWPSPKESWERRFIIHKQGAGESIYKNGQKIVTTEESFYITGTGAKRHRILADDLKTHEAAVARAKEMATVEKKKGVVEESLNINDVRREGPPRRPAGLDVSADDLMREFGFRGVNYGNWVKQGERQLFTNHAYDALLDLAEILNVPAKAMSLNGMLGLAFGAQGSGSASAHFMPGVNEVNLTRTQGAGSLAHEWAHGLDHYFASQAGEKFAKSADPFVSDLAINEKSGAALRPEIITAFKTIVDTMGKRPETQAEADAFLKAYNDKNVKGLTSWLNSLRNDLENSLKYAKKETTKALKEFDKLADRLRAGDLGEGFEQIGAGRDRMSQLMGGVHQAVGELRRLYKDYAGRVPEIQKIKNIDGWAGMLKSGMDKKSATPGTVDSNYKRSSRKLDSEKSGEAYWSTGHEMFARAFQSYVMDKLAVQSRLNDFLTRPQVDMSEFGDTFVYPKGEERTIINSAFDKLVSEIKTKETDKGVALFSPGHVYQPGEMLKSEADAFTTSPEAANAQAVADTRKVRPVGQWHDLRSDPAIKQIDKDFMERQMSGAIGKKIFTIQDVAEIAALARHPLIEHFTIVKLKKGKITGSLVLTSGKIGYVDPSMAEIQAFVSDADEFYASHNHPSGNATPSAEDISSTKAMASDKRFKGHVVTDHQTYTAIMPDGTAIAQAFKGEKVSFRTDIEKMSVAPAVVGWARGTLQGENLGVMFVDAQLQVMSFDQVSPTSDYNAYIKRHSKKYGATSVFLVAGEAAYARMSPKHLQGNYQDFIILKADGTYMSSKLGYVPGFNVVKAGAEGYFEAKSYMETQANYNPGEYAKSAGRWKPGKKLTLRSRFVNPSFPAGLPRGTEGKLLMVSPTTGRMIVDIGGVPVTMTPNMFRETYQAPEPMKVIPGQPIKRTIEQQTGVKPIEKQVITDQMTLLNRQLNTEAKAARRAAKVTRAAILEDIQGEKKNQAEVQKEVVDYIKANLPQSERGQFLGMVAKVKTRTELGKVMLRVDYAASDNYRKGIVADIKKVAGRALESKRVDVEYREAAKELLANIDFVKRRPDTILRLKAMREYISRLEASGRSEFIPDHIFKRLEILTLRPISAISEEELNIVLRDLLIIEAVGRETQERKEMADEIDKNIWLSGMAGEAKVHINMAEDAIGLQKVWAKAQEIYWSIAPMDIVLDRMGGGKGTYNSHHIAMKRVLDGDFFKFLDIRRNNVQPIVDLIDKHGLDQDSMERIGVYALKVQVNGTPRVLASMPELTEEYVTNLKLNAQEMEVYQKMREGMESLYPEMKRLMGKLYNKEVGSVENYFSFMTDWDKLTEMEVQERLAKTAGEFTGTRKNITAGFAKERKAGAKVPVQVNAMKVYLQHITDVAYFISMQEDIKKFSEIIKMEGYADAVGPQGFKIVSGWLDLLARQGKAEGSKKIPVLDIMRKNIGAATLGFKLTTFLIQTSSFLDAASAAGGWNVVSGMANVASDKQAMVWLRNNFPKLRERIGDDISIQDISEKEWLKKVQTLGYSPMKWLDGWVASSTVMAAIQKKSAELGIPVDYSKPPDPRVAEYANLVLSHTQASPFFIDSGIAFNSGKFLFNNVSLNKALLQFKQFVTNRWFYMSYDVPRMESKAQMAQAYAYLLAAGAVEMGVRGASQGIMLSILGGLGLGISAAVRGADDDDNQWRDYTLNLLGQIPFMDTIVSGIRYGSVPIPVLGQLTNFFTNSRDAINAQNEYKKRTGLRKSLIALASIMGIPGTAQVGQIWAWSYNPKTLTFPYNAEYHKLIDMGNNRTADDNLRIRSLNTAKGAFSAQAGIYRNAMKRGDTGVAAVAAGRAAEALKLL